VGDDRLPSGSTRPRPGATSGSSGPSIRPTVRVVAGLIANNGAYLITQRRPNAVLPLLWEFPGGRVEADETDDAALRRELHHRLDVDIEVGRLISFVSHSYDRYIVDLYLYDCTVVSGEPHEKNVNAFRWVQSKDFEKYGFTPADERSMSQLLGIDPQ
jgi:8-oxo-dGTP diphosphatase